MTLSKRFQEPASVYGIDSQGWNGEDASFYFPSFVIKPGGNVVSYKLPYPNTKLKQAIELGEPTEIDTDEVKHMSHNMSEIYTAWAMLICVVHNLTAPIYGYSPKGVILVDPLGPLVNKLASAMGCPIFNGFLSSTAIAENRLIDDESKTVWPIYYEGKPKRSSNVYRWFDMNYHNSFLCCDQWTEAVINVRGDWLSIVSDLAGKPSEKTLSIVRKLIPAYMKYLSERRWHRDNTQAFDHTIEQTCHELANWFQTTLKGYVDIVQTGGKMIRRWCHGSDADAFYRLVLQLHEVDAIAFKDNCDKPQFIDRKMRIFTYPDKVIIPKIGLETMLANKTQCILPLDIGAVSRALARNNELIEEVNISNTPCWVVTRESWDKHLKTFYESRHSSKRSYNDPPQLSQ